MNVEGKDPIDRAIDEALASMVGGEPRRVSASSVRRAMGESRGSKVPMWLAAAAMIVAALGVALRNDAPSPAPLAARSTPSPGVAPSSAPTPFPAPPEVRAAARPPGDTMTTEPVYEGLPRLEVAWIDLPPPLTTSRLGAEPIHIPGIEITPLSLPSLSNEQEFK